MHRAMMDHMAADDLDAEAGSAPASHNSRKRPYHAPGGQYLGLLGLAQRSHRFVDGQEGCHYELSAPAPTHRQGDRAHSPPAWHSTRSSPDSANTAHGLTRGHGLHHGETLLLRAEPFSSQQVEVSITGLWAAGNRLPHGRRRRRDSARAAVLESLGENRGKRAGDAPERDALRAPLRLDRRRPG
jgi:hypothetical protein